MNTRCLCVCKKFSEIEHRGKAGLGGGEMIQPLYKARQVPHSIESNQTMFKDRLARSLKPILQGFLYKRLTKLYRDYYSVKKENIQICKIGTLIVF